MDWHFNGCINPRLVNKGFVNPKFVTKGYETNGLKK
jgi:hypothetical protein